MTWSKKSFIIRNLWQQHEHQICHRKRVSNMITATSTLAHPYSTYKYAIFIIFHPFLVFISFLVDEKNTFLKHSTNTNLKWQKIYIKHALNRNEMVEWGRKGVEMGGFCSVWIKMWNDEILWELRGRLLFSF